MLTLWDLISPVVRLIAPAKPPAAVQPARPRAPSRRPARIRTQTPGTVKPAAPTAQERYERVVRELCKQHGLRVRRWRKSMSGIAWCVEYTDGTLGRFIEAPRPKSPLSMSIFLHEVGHHAIGFNRYKPRCLEEYHAWRWSLEAMERHGLEVTEHVRRRMALSLWYAVDKARRRGLRRLPDELLPFTQRPAPRQRTARTAQVA